ncbi:MAG: hypothetical protein LBJ94_02725 [Puniceicoccales bacterium]|nr:hypothetical protein [Puniceicoccales bacterium]
MVLASAKRSKHLKNFANPEVFDFTEKSLYGIVDVACDNHARLMLREHFRCTPKIIEFSNRNFYDGKLIPVKRFKSHGLTPLEHKYVEGGCQEGEQGAIHNWAEAKEIALKIAECIGDGRYFDENGNPKSMGVTALQGQGQKEYVEKALAELKIDELELAKRSFRIGDARTFQGDERDVIFLSMVVGGAGRKFRTLTTEEYQQRYEKIVDYFF